jgi:NitT/TauT family transport system permease protein
MKDKSPLSNLQMLALYLAPLVVFLIGWQLLTWSDPKRQFIFSSPALVWSAFCRLSANHELFENSAITLFEAVVGFVIGTTGGAFIGLALWCSKLTARIARPYITALASVPIFALTPIIIVWFGIGIGSKVALASISTAAVAIVQAYQGATSVNPSHLRLLTVAGATRAEILRIVIIPSSLIWVINAMKLNIGLALLGAFIGEFISSEQGLGYMIVRASGLYDMATVFVGVIALVAIALVLTNLVERLERLLLRWRNLETTE